MRHRVRRPRRLRRRLKIAVVPTRYKYNTVRELATAISVSGGLERDESASNEVIRRSRQAHRSPTGRKTRSRVPRSNSMMPPDQEQELHFGGGSGAVRAPRTTTVGFESRTYDSAGASGTRVPLNRWNRSIAVALRCQALFSVRNPPREVACPHAWNDTKASVATGNN